MTRILSRHRCRPQLEALENRLVPAGDMVLQWNDAVRDAIRIGATPATAGSRIMAITHAAIYDSVNALTRTHEVYLVDALAHPKASREAAVIACLDARMGEVYHAAYRRRGEQWSEVCAPGLYRPEAVPAPPGGDWSGCGSGFAAHADALARAYAGRLRQVRPELAPTATAVLRLAQPRFLRGEGRDAASAVPIYLRDKVALKTSERR